MTSTCMRFSCCVLYDRFVHMCMGFSKYLFKCYIIKRKIFFNLMLNVDKNLAKDLLVNTLALCILNQCSLWSLRWMTYLECNISPINAIEFIRQLFLLRHKILCGKTILNAQWYFQVSQGRVRKTSLLNISYEWNSQDLFCA